MGAYILRRLLLMIPTIFGIMAISFAIVQFAPGGPVEQVIADLTSQGSGDRLSGGTDMTQETGGDGAYRGARGLDPEFIAKLETIDGMATLDGLITTVKKELDQLWKPDSFQIAVSDSNGAHVIQLALSYIQENYRRVIL